MKVATILAQLYVL